uniref:60S acidic ribosomal protein P3 n=1 Tax=Araucaria cunninghamii TaxID=56994 RepID=A0A0D6R062_ARACU
MGVYTFICKESGGSWNAKQYSGDLEGNAASTWDLQRYLVNEALKAEGSAPVQSSFSYVSPSSAVFQVILGGGGGGGFIATGGAVAAPAGGAAATPAAEAPAEEKKKEEEEESDDDMGFSLFD